MTKPYLFVLCGMLLGIHVFWAYDPLALYRNPQGPLYLEYLDAFQASSYALALFLWVCMVGFLSFISRSEKPRASSPMQWLLGFCGILLPLISLNVYVNPHGIYPWSHFPSMETNDYVGSAIRNYKLKLFRDLDAPAEVVIMGSSRAYTLPSEYVQQKTGYDTFNISFIFGRPVDFLAFGKLILSEQAEHPPVVFIVELVNLDDFTYPMPISLLPFLPAERGIESMDYIFHDVNSIRSLSDTLFQLTYARLHPQTPRLSFKPDGTGVRRPITEETYINRFDESARNVDKISKCNQLNPEGKRLIEAFVQLAGENQTAVLFYRSPLNADYLEIGETDHPLYQKCEALLLAFMGDLAEQYPNVFFRDLTYYQPISSLRWDGYYDAHHLKPKAAQMLIDVLAPDISDAADWALQQRRQ